VKQLASASLVTVLAAGLLAGCGDDDREYTAVCVDQNGNRVADNRCHGDRPYSDGINTFMLYYMLSSMNQPALGSQVVHNNYYSHSKYAGFTKPKSATVYKGVPSSGYKPKSGTSFKSKSYVSKPQSNTWKGGSGGSINKGSGGGYKAPGGGFNKPANPAPRIGGGGGGYRK